MKIKNNINCLFFVAATLCLSSCKNFTDSTDKGSTKAHPTPARISWTDIQAKTQAASERLVSSSSSPDATPVQDELAMLERTQSDLRGLISSASNNIASTFRAKRLLEKTESSDRRASPYIKNARRALDAGDKARAENEIAKSYQDLIKAYAQLNALSVYQQGDTSDPFASSTRLKDLAEKSQNELTAMSRTPGQRDIETEAELIEDFEKQLGAALAHIQNRSGANPPPSRFLIAKDNLASARSKVGRLLEILNDPANLEANATEAKNLIAETYQHLIKGYSELGLIAGEM